VITLDSQRKTYNEWKSSPDSGHKYFIHKNRDSTKKVINDLLEATPKNTFSEAQVQ
jgi:hypothetical protein